MAARSRIFRSRPQEELPAAQDWVPAGLEVTSPGAAAAVAAVEEAEGIPADPAAAAELGAEVQRLRRELKEAEERAQSERSRADDAEREVAALRERAEAMKRAAARAAAAAYPEEGDGGAP